MLISHRKQFIYTKTLKTAGTSVEVYFEPWCMAEGAWSFLHVRDEHESAEGVIGCRSGDQLLIQACTWWNHMPARTIRALVGDAVWDRYFKFCVVRDPFDKVVSAFHFFIRGQRRSLQPDTLKAEMAAWLGKVRLPVDRNKYLIDGAFCLDDVIRYESLAADLQRVCERLEVPFEPDRLPHIKRGQRPGIPLADYFTPETRDHVARAFEFELSRFGYNPPG